MNKKKCVLLCFWVALNFTISYPGSAAPTATSSSAAEQSKDNSSAAAALSNPTEQNIEALGEALERDSENMLNRKALETLAEYGNPYARNEVYRLGIWEKPQTPKEEKEKYICNSFEDYQKKKDDIEKYNQTVGTKQDFKESTTDDAVQQLTFPVVYERIGPMIDREEFNYSPQWNKPAGWTLSIAPRFSSFKTVLGEVRSLHERNKGKRYNFSYLYAANAETIRKRYYGQQTVKGSIVLFFEGAVLLKSSLEYLESAFKRKGLSREDFLYIDDHFQVGEGGALYAKLLIPGEDMVFWGKEGNKEIIRPSLFRSYIKTYDIDANTYIPCFSSLKNRGIILPKKVSDIVDNPKYNGIIPPIAGIGEPTDVKDAPLNQDLLKTTLKTPTKENVDKLAEAIVQDDRKVKTTYNAARVILETLGDDGNTAAIEKLYELGIWKPAFDGFDWKAKLAESKEAEWQGGNPTEHKLYGSNETLDKEFDDFVDMLGETYPSLRASFTAPYLKYPMENPLVSPCAIEYTGNMRHPSRLFLYLFSERRNQNDIGWKMHISARISSAKKIAEIVIPYLEKQKVQYKFFSSIPTLRLCYNAPRYGRTRAALSPPFSQKGKFIAIYPESDEQAKKIAVDLDKAFKDAKLTREDFVYVNGDFQVGDSGGIFTRLTHYKYDLDTKRGHVNIGPGTLLSYLEGVFYGQPISFDVRLSPEFDRPIDKRGFPICLGRNYAEALAVVTDLSKKLRKPEILDYEHPFSLGLKHRGQDMPKKILDILQCIGDEPDMDAFRDYVYRSK
ncbi:MAG: hypothetical protein LBT70_00175 [Holosporaceae bacterium]|jgi:hypothetical protein|nr:hypothetical protein [Holosporaceae bacterium]